LQVTPSEAFASYISAWNFSKVHGFGMRLARAGLGYGSLSQSWSEVFQFLLDAFDHGYVVKVSDWDSAVDLLSELYVKAAAETLSSVDFSTDERADQTQERFRELVERPIQPEQVNKILSWFVVEAFTSIDIARGARTADEWLMSKARVFGRVRCVGVLEHAFRDAVKIPATLGAQMVQLEEIRADLGGEARSAPIKAQAPASGLSPR
jgi:hypothetical protein